MDQSARVVIRPLERHDPPMLGAVMIHGRLASTDAGVVYAGQLVDDQVVVVTLTDAAQMGTFGRARFDSAVKEAVDDGAARILAADLAAAVSPWVAFAAPEDWDDALGLCDRVLARVALADQGLVGDDRGTRHWYRRREVDRRALWPLPGPGGLAAAGRWTFIAAYALMLGIAAIALWITTVIFHNQPVPPPPLSRITRTFTPPPPVIHVPSASPNTADVKGRRLRVYWPTSIPATEPSILS